MNATSFRGIYTALVTPFTSDGTAVDHDRLAENVREQAADRVAGVVPCGTTGESPTLSDAEHRAVIERTIEVARPLGLQVIAGAGSNDTAYAVHLHRFAQSVGAHGSLQVNPYYNKPSPEGLYRHFMTIADACDLSIVLYNIPGRTGVRLELETIERLAQHPNIIAIKEATGSLDLASEICALGHLSVLSGDDSLTLPIAAVGGTGAVSVISNLVPDRLTAMWDAIERNDWPAARALHQKLLPLARGLLSLDTNPIPAKAALRLLGRDTGALRLPLTPVGTEVEATIAELLTAQSLGRTAQTA